MRTRPVRAIQFSAFGWLAPSGQVDLLDLFLRAVPPAKMVPALGLRRSMRVDAKYLQRNFLSADFFYSKQCSQKNFGAERIAESLS
jgi:hypothetical protein